MVISIDELQIFYLHKATAIGTLIHTCQVYPIRQAFAKEPVITGLQLGAS